MPIHEIKKFIESELLKSKTQFYSINVHKNKRGLEINIKYLIGKNIATIDFGNTVESDVPLAIFLKWVVDQFTLFCLNNYRI